MFLPWHCISFWSFASSWEMASRSDPSLFEADPARLKLIYVKYLMKNCGPLKKINLLKNGIFFSLSLLPTQYSEKSFIVISRNRALQSVGNSIDNAWLRIQLITILKRNIHEFYVCVLYFLILVPVWRYILSVIGPNRYCQTILLYTSRRIWIRSVAASFSGIYLPGIYHDVLTSWTRPRTWHL